MKNYHWLDLVAGLYDAYDRGGETVILVDQEGNVVEGPGFNVFTVKDEEISTPGRGVLEGITRKTVIELAAEWDIPLETRDLPVEEFRAVFIMSDPMMWCSHNARSSRGHHRR